MCGQLLFVDDSCETNQLAPIRKLQPDPQPSNKGDRNDDGDEPTTSPYLDRLAIRKRRRLVVVKVEEIDRIEAAGNYVEIITGKTKHLLRATMTLLEKRLDPRHFLRVHRSTILNSDRIREVESTANGDLVALLDDGSKVAWSRGYRTRLNALLERQGA